MKDNLPAGLECERLCKESIFMSQTNHKVAKQSVTAALLNIKSLDKYLRGIVYWIKLVINGISDLILESNQE